MKCEECGGTGKVQKWFYERTGFGKCEKVCGDVKCEWCNGTGEVKETNFDRITKSPEALASLMQNCVNCDDCPITDKSVCKYKYENCKEEWIAWLKQESE